MEIRRTCTIKAQQIPVTQELKPKSMCQDQWPCVTLNVIAIHALFPEK